MLDTRAQDHEIKAHALWFVGRVKALIYGIGKTQARATPSRTNDGMPTIAWHTSEAPPTTGEQLGYDLDQLARDHNARPCDDKITLSGKIARMSDAAWWVKNLRRETVKRNEVIEHHNARIRRKGQCYASDHAHKIKTERARANRRTLEGMEVVNELGQAFNLQEVADKSVSNPKIRRGELMTRARGFEEAAEFMGHQAIFLTLTCPSRFHRFSGTGQENKAWTGATPKDAQEYLCATWAKIRASWNRRKITPYGFRVAEPHHDACPHWHILLFVDALQLQELCQIAQNYALKDSPSERGALKHRFTWEKIDTTRGSATGYIAKYIAKNIDGLTEAGENVGLDFASGKKATDASQRVKTWATTWGIRQFQQIGGPSVTVWRELRRLDKVANSVQRDLLQNAQAAADRADWMGFWMVQGGPNVQKKMLPLSPNYDDFEGGKYGDSVRKITGVTKTEFCMVAKMVEKQVKSKDKKKTYTRCKFTLTQAIKKQEFTCTRLHQWTVQRAGVELVEQSYFDRLEDMEASKNVARFLSEAGKFGVGFSGASRPWTGVNNCTGQAFDFSQFDRDDEPIPFSFEYTRAGSAADVANDLRILKELQDASEYQWRADERSIRN